MFTLSVYLLGFWIKNIKFNDFNLFIYNLYTVNVKMLYYLYDNLSSLCNLEVENTNVKALTNLKWILLAFILTTLILWLVGTYQLWLFLLMNLTMVKIEKKNWWSRVMCNVYYRVEFRWQNFNKYVVWKPYLESYLFYYVDTYIII